MAIIWAQDTIHNDFIWIWHFTAVGYGFPNLGTEYIGASIDDFLHSTISLMMMLTHILLGTDER